jgi:hypothetical protein
MRKPSSTADDEDEIPEGIVTVPPDYEEDSVKTRDENNKMCYIYRGLTDRQDGLESCKKQCQATLHEAEEEGRNSNYGCYSIRPLDSPITWQRSPSTGLEVIGGQCTCDNWILNDLMETIMEALPAIFQVSSYACSLRVSQSTYLHLALDHLLHLLLHHQAGHRCWDVLLPTRPSAHRRSRYAFVPLLANVTAANNQQTCFSQVLK